MEYSSFDKGESRSDEHDGSLHFQSESRSREQAGSQHIQSSSTGELSHASEQPNTHPELIEAASASSSGFGNYLSKVIQQEIELRKSRGEFVEVAGDDACDQDCVDARSACSTNGCEILDFRPRRPERPVDDSWGDDSPRNPPPKRFTDDYPRFGSPFPWDYL